MVPRNNNIWSYLLWSPVIKRVSMYSVPPGGLQREKFGGDTMVGIRVTMVDTESYGAAAT